METRLSCNQTQSARAAMSTKTNNNIKSHTHQRSEFVNVGALTPRKSRFFVKFRHLRLATCIDSVQTPSCETLIWLGLFPQPMDRAEVLHMPNYNIKDSWKNTPSENELVLPCETFTFRSKMCTYVKPHLPLNMPAATKSITLQEENRLYESLLESRVGAIRVSEANSSILMP